MKTSEVAHALRELADRFEALGLDDGDELTANARVNFHHVDTREQLAKLLPMLDRPRLNAEVPCIASRATEESPVEITLFHKSGVLGGESRTIYIDTQAGLDALVAEQSEGAEEALRSMPPSEACAR